MRTSLGEAIVALERVASEYTIHKFFSTEESRYYYECYIDPEYAYCMELVCTRARATGDDLLQVIEAAISNLQIRENTKAIG